MFLYECMCIYIECILTIGMYTVCKAFVNVHCIEGMMKYTACFIPLLSDICVNCVLETLGRTSVKLP